MITDADRIKWLLQNVNYFEHHATKEKPMNFWPHEQIDNLLCDERFVDMNIIEYIDARIGE